MNETEMKIKKIQINEIITYIFKLVKVIVFPVLLLHYSKKYIRKQNYSNQVRENYTNTQNKLYA